MLKNSQLLESERTSCCRCSLRFPICTVNNAQFQNSPVAARGVTIFRRNEKEPICKDTGTGTGTSFPYRPFLVNLHVSLRDWVNLENSPIWWTCLSS